MSLKALKVLARTHSLEFTRDYLGRKRNGKASVSWWNGDGRPVHYRPGTSDVSIFYDILFRKSEYWLPEGLAPRVIFDIGGNIGIAARYLAQRFPQAEVHSFEPVVENLELMQRNLQGTAVRALLARLAPWFDIEVHKRLRKQTWFFDACNRAASQRFRGFRRGR